jgi:ectoine hydroxylase-related dioxygenase (phytanoyl-CoA dioxygenase family)
MAQHIEDVDVRCMTFARDGAQHFRAALDPAALHDVDRALTAVPVDQAGVRLYGNSALRSLLSASGRVGAIAASVLGPACQPVRAILFDKTSTTNWSLAWHQDRTIVVDERADVEGFGPWTIKGGLIHVAPPVAVLASMVTLRVHLDPVPVTNAPLLVAPGSHKFGRIREADVPDVVRRCGTLACLADAGDVWLYATLILHASEVAHEPARRRVLQVDYAANDLPGGLKWLGI